MEQPQAGAADHIELEQLNGLIAAAGVEGAREILNSFWSSAEELLTAAAEQLDGGDLETAAQTAHAIKGMAANVGASKLSSTAADLEVACRNKDAGAAPGHINDARADFEAARGWLLEHLKQAS